MQARHQTEGDDLADPALVLLRFPIELKRTDGGELREHGGDDDEVEEVAEVDPYDDKEGKVRDLVRGLYVVEGFGGLGSGKEVSKRLEEENLKVHQGVVEIRS